MNGGTSNHKWAIIAATVGAFNMFLPPWHEAKHADPESRTATDCRQGYGLALGWSFLTGMVIAGDSDPTAIISLWAISAIVIIFIYESYIRSTRSVGGGEVDET